MSGPRQKEVARVLCALCGAFNDKDAERAASLFVFPVRFSTGGATNVRQDAGALIEQFEAHFCEHAAAGIAGYRIRIDDAVIRGETAEIGAVWTHRLAEGGYGASMELNYALRRTPEGWRIVGAEAVDVT